MGKVKYPNPKFFKAKDNIDWAAQGKNLKEVGGIFWDMFKATDWKKFGQSWKSMLVSDRDRVKEEYNAFMACSTKDKTPPTTSMNGPACGACCSARSPRT